MFDAARYRTGRAIGGLVTIVIAILVYQLIPVFQFDVVTFNRSAGAGTPQRNLIDGLADIRDHTTSHETWPDDICHPSVCADFAAFERDVLADVTPRVDDCLTPETKIKMKPAGGVLDGSDRLFWLACEGEPAWLRARMRKEDATKERPERWLIVSLEFTDDTEWPPAQ